MKFTISIFLVLISPAVSAWTLFLEQDFGIKGNMRYCKYSDGKTYSFNAVSLCPVSIQGSAPGMGNGTGFLKGQYLDGMTRVCVYDVLGQKKAKRVNSTDLCPISADF
jgi:hypothetical protein